MWRRYLVGNWSFLFWTLVWRVRHADPAWVVPELTTSTYPEVEPPLESMIPQRQVIDLTAVPHPQAPSLVEPV